MSWLSCAAFWVADSMLMWKKKNKLISQNNNKKKHQLKNKYKIASIGPASMGCNVSHIPPFSANQGKHAGETALWATSQC